MKTVTKFYNHRVVVLPIEYQKGMFPTTQACENHQLRQCKAVREAILRHVDGIGAVNIEWDGEVVCCHCEQIMEPDEIGRPWCCDKAVDDYCREFGP